MTIDPRDLPNDPAILRELVFKLVDSIHEGERTIERLLHENELLRRHRFGRRSEKIDPAQLTMPFPETDAPDPPPGPPPGPKGEARPAKNGHGRAPLPSHLKREEVVHDVPEDRRVCADCGRALVEIGQETSEQLDYRPAALFVRRRVRRKYACKACAGNVVVAETPPQPIDKGLPGASLLAHVIVSKYADHLPLYRQSEIFARQGVELSRSTLCDWVARSADLLEPIVRAMEAKVLESRKIHTDDTPVPVLDPTRGRTRRGYLWPYLGDRDHPYIVFRYTPKRSRDGPRRVLRDYRGWLQADAYSGYDNLYADLAIVEVACWAHARRYFFEARTSDALHADLALAYVARLYDVEREAKGLSDDERRARREAGSRPVLDDFKAWLDRQASVVLPRSPMGQAIQYARTHWTALTRYLEDGILDIDNNAAERALRCVALGRKNWLFAGSDRGGERAAVHYSLVATCKEHAVDPLAYFADLLDRVSTHPASRIEELLPDRWKRLHAAAAEVATPSP